RRKVQRKDDTQLSRTAERKARAAVRSLLKNYGSLDCERGGCDDEARRPSISVVICQGGATKSARPPRHKMNCCSFSTDSLGAGACRHIIAASPATNSGSPPTASDV